MSIFFVVVVSSLLAVYNSNLSVYSVCSRIKNFLFYEDTNDENYKIKHRKQADLWIPNNTTTPCPVYRNIHSFNVGITHLNFKLHIPVRLSMIRWYVFFPADDMACCLNIDIGLVKKFTRYLTTTDQMSIFNCKWSQWNLTSWGYVLCKIWFAMNYQERERESKQFTVSYRCIGCVKQPQYTDTHTSRGTAA